MKKYVALSMLFAMFIAASVFANDTGPPSATTNVLRTANTKENVQAVPVAVPHIAGCFTLNGNHWQTVLQNSQYSAVTISPPTFQTSAINANVPSENTITTTTINTSNQVMATANQSPPASTYTGTPPIVLVESPLYIATMPTTTIASPAKMTKTSMVMQTHMFNIAEQSANTLTGARREGMSMIRQTFLFASMNNNSSIAFDQGQVIAANQIRTQAMQQQLESTV